MAFESWHVWVMAGLVLAAMELFGAAFVALAFGVSCLVAAVVAGMGAGLNVQILAAAISAAVLTPCFVLWWKRHSKANLGTYALAGESGSSNQPGVIVKYGDGVGVKLGPDIFPVRMSDGDVATLTPDQRVIIERFEGITAIVKIDREGVSN